jgi:RHS repeat-associated protein
MVVSEFESENNMNNWENNTKRLPRQLARRKSARGCEPSSLMLPSQLSSLFPYRHSVTDGDTTRMYTYHADGQLSRANYGGNSEEFLWDGLALVRRNDEHFINEPHVGGGNPVASSNGTSYFNDALGTTVGAKKDGRYSAAALSAFGEDISASLNRSPFPVPSSPFFTGKPYVEGLGHAFLMRNYRAGLAKWQTADPMGYPDGWNALAYCNNCTIGAVDQIGGWCEAVHHDINATYLTNQGIAAHSYKWGGLSLDVLNGLNAGSDWADSFSEGNQDDCRAYLHAMRSSNQTEFEAEIAWTAYRASLVQSAKELSDLARLFYRDGFLIVAASLENEAINQLGKLFHTFDDSFAPPHSGFQHFSWFSALDHVARETMSVYETGIYQYWISTGQFTPPITIEVVYRTGGFRGHIYEQIDLLYTDTVKYVLRQPE